MTESLLGKTANGPITADQIELWEVGPTMRTVAYDTDELLCNCPVTNQPDVYHARIEWNAGAAGFTFESKAMKHYLWGFRDKRLSCEALAASIADDLSKRLDHTVHVTLTQQVRGGLTLSATAEGADL